ncbi:hypothetical protein AAVH_16682 [Aphelenchoides avenae]|nr:hypothetical protein AAVH_16682 [Aphelenchus avenae]
MSALPVCLIVGVLTAACPCVFAAHTTDVSTTDELAFKEFMKKFNQTFDGDERGRRLKIFAENLKRIAQLKRDGAQGIGINRFAASTLEEMQQRLVPVDFEKTLPSRNDSRAVPPRRQKRQAPPTSFDYRSKGWVSPVKDQGQCGSCWAFATVSLEESVMMRAYGWSHDLSEQILVDCTTSPNYGCGGGWVNVAVDYIRTKGMTYESYYPYTASQTTCHGVPTQFTGYLNYFYIGSEADIAYYVYNYGSVAFYFRVPYAWYYYTGGVFDVPDCTTYYGLHEVVIVGYTTDYWIVKNSWGTGWGDAGYVYYKRGKNLCGMSVQLIGSYFG